MGDLAFNVVVAAAIGTVVAVPLLALAVTWSQVAWQKLQSVFRSKPLRWVLVLWLLTQAMSLSWTYDASGTLGLGSLGLGNYVKLGLMTLTAFLVMALGLRNRFDFLAPFARPPLALFGLFTMWALASTLWSVSVPSTVFKVAEYLLDLIAAALAIHFIRRLTSAREERVQMVKVLFDWFWVILGAMLASVAIGLLIAPSRTMFHGVGTLGIQIQGFLPFLSENGVGDTGATLGIVALSRMLAGARPRWFYAVVLTASVAAIIFSQTRSAMLAFALAVPLVLVLYGRFGQLTALVGVAIAVAGVPFLRDTLTSFLVRGQPYGVATLSGRTDWWTAALHSLSKRPIEGWGAFAGGKYILRNDFHDTSSTLHNTYIEVLADTGVVGLALFLSGIADVLRHVGRRLRVVRRSPTLEQMLWIEAGGLIVVKLARSVFSVPFIWPPVLPLSLLLVIVGVLGTTSKR